MITWNPNQNQHCSALRVRGCYLKRHFWLKNSSLIYKIAQNIWMQFRQRGRRSKARGYSQEEDLDHNLGHLHNGSDSLKNSCSFKVTTIQRWMLLSLASKFFPRLYQDQPGKGLRGDKCKAAPWTWDGAEIEPGLLGHSRWQEWNGKARKDLKKLDMNLMWWRKKASNICFFFTFCEALKNSGPCHVAWAAP